MAPNRDRFKEAFACAFGPDHVETVMDLIHGDQDPESVEATANWVRNCYRRPRHHELVMHAVNALVGADGVEAVTMPGETFPTFSYINRGDTYDHTLIFDLEVQKYEMASWGDYYETVETERAENDFGELDRDVDIDP